MSPRLIKSVGSGTSSGVARKRRATRKPNKATATDAATPASSGAVGGTSETVNLDSGGTLSVVATIDPFSLSKADREFIYDLIDKLSDYAARQEELEPEDDEAGSEGES